MQYSHIVVQMASVQMFGALPLVHWLVLPVCTFMFILKRVLLLVLALAQSIYLQCVLLLDRSCCFLALCPDDHSVGLSIGRIALARLEHWLLHVDDGAMAMLPGGTASLREPVSDVLELAMIGGAMESDNHRTSSFSWLTVSSLHLANLSQAFLFLTHSTYLCEPNTIEDTVSSGIVSEQCNHVDIR